MKITPLRITERLIIRVLELSDYNAWKNCHLNLKKAKNRWDQGPKEAQELAKSEFLKILKFQKKRRESDSYYELAVFTHKGELIGQVSLMEVSRGVSQSAFLGYRIYNLFWGQGHAHQAIKAIIDIGFRDINLHRIEAGIEPQNHRSIKTAQRLNMRHEGLKKRAIFLRQKWVDLLIYTLTTEDLGIEYKIVKI